MKVSINNFKTIRNLEGLEIKPLNIISGVNSSGKSSLIQFLLLLKQSIEEKATDTPLVFNSVYVELGNFLEISTKQDPEKIISFTITLEDNEFGFSEFGVFKIKQFDFSVSLSGNEKEVSVERLELKYTIPDTLKKEQWLLFEKSNSTYSAKANTGLFNNDFYQLAIDEGKEYFEGELLFTSIFPQTFSTQIKNPDYPDFSRSEFRQYTIEPEIQDLRQYIESQFNSISYLGPLREKPSDIYRPNKIGNNIGTRGEYSAYILEKEAADIIEHYVLKLDGEGLASYSLKKEKLSEAVNYWICNVFKLAEKIYAKEIQEEYEVRVINHFGVETTIKHVGFGISQVLPIIIEGLRMPANGILILEQPEIHLHPKVQGLLFDFLYGLVLMGKRIIVETHSDNLISRMRRRIAEDQNDKIVNLVNLIFVEERESNHIFRNLDMTNLGSLTYFPKDFVEEQDDYRAIVRAQALKKQKSKS